MLMLQNYQSKQTAATYSKEEEEQKPFLPDNVQTVVNGESLELVQDQEATIKMLKKT